MHFEIILECANYYKCRFKSLQDAEDYIGDIWGMG